MTLDRELNEIIKDLSFRVLNLKIEKGELIEWLEVWKDSGAVSIPIEKLLEKLED